MTHEELEIKIKKKNENELNIEFLQVKMRTNTSD